MLPRLGALLMLGGLAYGLALYGRMAYVTAVEGLWSWAWTLLLLAPMALLSTAAAILVLRGHRLGRRLTRPVLALALVTGLWAIANAPPVGGFLSDYEEASLARGIEVPPFEASQGLTAAEYADKIAGDFKLQGALIAMGAALGFYILVRRGAIFVRRRRAPSPPAGSPEASAKAKAQ